MVNSEQSVGVMTSGKDLVRCSCWWTTIQGLHHQLRLKGKPRVCKNGIKHAIPGTGQDKLPDISYLAVSYPGHFVLGHFIPKKLDISCLIQIALKLTDHHSKIKIKYDYVVTGTALRTDIWSVVITEQTTGNIWVPKHYSSITWAVDASKNTSEISLSLPPPTTTPKSIKSTNKLLW